MEKGYKVIEENGRIKYQCEKCQVKGTEEETIMKGYCHKRNSSHRFGDIEVKTKKKEQKYKVKGMGISIKKFDSYFE